MVLKTAVMKFWNICRKMSEREFTEGSYVEPRFLLNEELRQI